MPEIRLAPGDLKELSGLGLSQDAWQQALLWPMRTMFGAPYVSAKLEVADSGKVTVLDIKWEEPKTEWERRRQAYYELKLKGKLSEYSGDWVVLTAGRQASLFDSATAAREFSREGMISLLKFSQVSWQLAVSLLTLSTAQILTPSLRG